MQTQRDWPLWSAGGPALGLGARWAKGKGDVGSGSTIYRWFDQPRLRASEQRCNIPIRRLPLLIVLCLGMLMAAAHTS